MKRITDLPTHMMVQRGTRTTEVMQTRPPYYIFQVWKFRDQESFEKFTDTPKLYDLIKGYRIALTVVGPLEDNDRNPVPSPVSGLILATDFYLTHKIQPNEAKFKRYRIT